VTLANYLRSFHGHDDRRFPGREALQTLAHEVAALRRELPEVEIDLCSLDDPREASLRIPGYSGCSGGKVGLVVGADGRVSLCDRLLPFPEAVVGDVTRSTLAEIWNGPRLRRFVAPPVADYAGTACASCSLKSDCDRRIRCYYRAKVITGRLFAPDYLCERLPPPAVRFH
jgi:radical SAM protein with 4Fe4S-binding SPASM domain